MLLENVIPSNRVKKWFSNRGELVALVSIDLSEAFNVIQYDLLLAKLKEYCVGERSCALLKDNLTARHQRVKIENTFATRKGVRR